MWECPNLFPTDINGHPSDQEWVLIISTNRVPEHDSAAFYLTGTFDGHAFAADDPERWHPLDHGRDFYAAVSFANTTREERIILGWANNWQYADDAPTRPWRGAMSLPRQLKVTEAGLRQCLPAAAESTLPSRPDWTYRTESFEAPVTFDAGGHYRLRLTWTLGDASAISIGLLTASGSPPVALRYDSDAKQLTFDRTRSGRNDFHPQFPRISSVQLHPSDNLLELDIFVDGCIIEVFANRGDATMTMQAFPDHGARGVVLSASSKARVGVVAELYDLARLHSGHDGVAE